MRQISPDLLAKLNSNIQTPANNAQPRMSVQVSRARSAVVDSSYWTVETIRTKPGIGDISLAARRQKNFGRPDRMYEIHVDNGIVKTTIREYPDTQQNGWMPQFELGPGTSVAIAFDGEWELWRKRWRLKTTEKPWIFWVDNTGKLFTQKWDEIDTRAELATGVVKVKAMRGWKNQNFADRDHGIIAGYIKTDGKLYYRNYCQAIDFTTAWEVERAIITTFNAVNLNLFLLNDYRSGFVVEDTSGNIHWLITERNWAGMAIAPETISASPVSLKINMKEIDYKNIYPTETLTAAPISMEARLLYADTDNDVSAINIPNESDNWGWIIKVEFDHPVPELTLSNTTVTNVENLTTIELSSIEKQSDLIYKLNVSDVVESGINNVEGDIKVDITAALNPAGYEYINMTNTFTPLNLVPTFIPLPEVEVIFNE